ncbi:MAG: MATE family efflux transporter [Fusobacterium perfoetens]|uniref:MATE family efflux transporter n=1 Tax=Fusobacterium perfoetens TaxID=852 RepID=UPI0023F3500E|nr:MATE family efflux transporter [Fusobacterium perfoetens]MCI6153406.1 MATE family efflux transporter [Fusobacterium perfoetens]MDY3238451.1 MATE family efflux transporter [Fusobacterium perfoetens]
MTRQELEFREGNIIKLLIKFSVPATFASLITIIYNVTDRYYIGQAVGRNGIGAIATIFPLIMLLNACGTLFAIGGGALSGIYLGKQEIDNARKILGVSFFCLLVIGLFFTSFGTIFMKQIILFLGATENTIEYAMDYCKYFFPSMTFQILILAFSAFLRTDGRPILSMMTNFISAISNMGLDYLWVVKLSYGMKGAALATTISNVIPGIFLITYFLRGKLLKLEFKHVRGDIKTIREILSVGISGFFNQSLNGVYAYALNTRLIKYGGDLAIAGMGIMTIVRNFLNTSYLGLNQGRQPILSYNWGAKNYRRVLKTFAYSIGISIFLAIFLVFLIKYHAREIAGFFVKNDPELIEYTAKAIPIHLGMMMSTAIYLSCANYFQAVGKGMVTTKLITLRLLILTIPLTYILPLKWGVMGVLRSFPISDTIAAITAAIVVSKEIKHVRKLMKEQEKIEMAY